MAEGETLLGIIWYYSRIAVVVLLLIYAVVAAYLAKITTDQNVILGSLGLAFAVIGLAFSIISSMAVEKELKKLQK